MNVKRGRLSGSSENKLAGWGRQPQDREEQSNLKRLAILKTAAALFNERGYYAASLGELASRLNISKPTLYYYVKNKDDILKQVLQQAMLDIDPIIAHARETGDDGHARLKIFVERYVVWLTGDFGKCLVLCGIAPLERESQEELQPAFRRIDASVRQMLTEGMRDGSIRPRNPKLAAFALFGAMHWVTSWFRPDGEFDPAKIADEIFSFFDTGLNNDGAVQGAPATRSKPAPKGGAAS